METEAEGVLPQSSHPPTAFPVTPSISISSSFSIMHSSTYSFLSIHLLHTNLTIVTSSKRPGIICTSIYWDANMVICLHAHLFNYQRFLLSLWNVPLWNLVKSVTFSKQYFYVYKTNYKRSQLQSLLSIHGGVVPDPTTDPQTQRSLSPAVSLPYPWFNHSQILVLERKNLHVNGHMQFKPMLFKGRLYIEI